eukprot:c19049_g1_i4.p2 GENE.c19049_g1_i4~~c19049_g1_i4.p2  ORF type:complete len:110 (-),score=15.69 c19049_g1_i4:19-348(-)
MQSYVKAHGQGIGLGLQSLTFEYTKGVWGDACRVHTLHDKHNDHLWQFHLQYLDDAHVTCFALAPPQSVHSSFCSTLPINTLNSLPELDCTPTTILSPPELYKMIHPNT